MDAFRTCVTATRVTPVLTVRLLIKLSVRLIVSCVGGDIVTKCLEIGVQGKKYVFSEHRVYFNAIV
jgi:hypothetical protein